MCCICTAYVLQLCCNSSEYSKESNQWNKIGPGVSIFISFPLQKNNFSKWQQFAVQLQHIFTTYSVQLSEEFTALLQHMCCTTTAHLQHMLCSIICIFTALLQHMCCIITAHSIQFDSNCATILLLYDVFIVDFIIDLLSLCFGYC